MRVVFSSVQLELDAVYQVDAGIQVPPSEVPARAEAILHAMELDRGFTIEAPTDHGLEPITAVHDPAMVSFLGTAWDEWAASGHSAPLFPDTLMHRSLRGGLGPAPEPDGPLARMGYWCFETYTPIVEGTYRAARAAVDVALTAADLALKGEPIVYGLCRPPGHHVGPRVFGGSSYLNNAAIAVEHIVGRSGERVAVLDLDYHHGNGTQQLFYERGDVLYVSLHGDPMRAWPYFTGHADERGRGPGDGANRNFPLPAGCDDDTYRAALDEALGLVRAHGTQRLVVSLGFDTYRLDAEDFELSNRAYHAIGELVAAAAPSVIVLQEGGYFVPHLGRNAVQWLRGAEGRPFEPDAEAP